MQTSSLLSLVFSLFSLAAAITQQDATAAFDQLQTWYNESIGLWIPSTGWWNSANCLTVIADLAQIDFTVATQAEQIYHTTWTRAQKYNLQLEKTVDKASYLPVCHYHEGPRRAAKGFSNDYYDDE